MDKNNTLPKEIEVNNKVYSVIKLLGKGKGGYSYLVIRDDKKYVLKQIHHEPCDYYNFGNKIEAELNDYKRLLALGIPLPLMIEVDISKERILKEFIDGLTADELIKRNNLPQMVIYGLRHSFATHCRNLGVKSEILAKLMGHSEYETTQKYYIHIFLNQIHLLLYCLHKFLFHSYLYL